MRAIALTFAILALRLPVCAWGQGGSHDRSLEGYISSDSAAVATAASVPVSAMPMQPPPEVDANRSGRLAVEVASGVVGAIVVSIPAAVVGSGLGPQQGDDPGVLGAIFGFLVGSAAGSAIGVHLAGAAQGDQGRLGSALVGGVLGLVSFLMITPYLDADHAPFFAAAWGLPAVGAVIGHRTSRPPSASRQAVVPSDGLRPLLVMRGAGGFAFGLSLEF